MIELPRVLSSKLDRPVLSMNFTPRLNVYVIVTWRAFSVNMDTKKALYSIDMKSIKGLMPCKVTGGAPVDFETFKRKVVNHAAK